MADLGVVATEIFQILRSFDYTVRLYDENGMNKTEPSEARRFMCYPHNLMVSLVDDDDNSRITLHIGKSTNIGDIFGLDQKLRTIATKYNMIFRAQQYGKDIDPKTFGELASVTEGKGMHVCEGMYGTSRSSYLRLENARMIVRHNQRIDDSKIGARGRFVESVLIENPAGERFRMPTTNLLPGRAMTQHVNQGGGFADPVGQQIGAMASDYQNLGIGVTAAIGEAAQPLREACQCKRDKLRKTFERLYRPGSYTEAAADLGQQEMLTETQITETRLAELRQLLHGDHEESVYECCARALDEMAQPMPEARRMEPMMSVLGQQVAVAAWHAFWDDGQLPVRRPPSLSIPSKIATGVRNAFDNLAFRLHELSAVTQDDGLAMLFDKIADQMPREQDPKRRQIYKTIAARALKAASGQTLGLADQHPAVAEHLSWFGKFDPDRVLLAEIAVDPMDPSFDSAPYEMAADSMLAQFDANEFIDSPEMQDTIDGRDPHSEDNHIERDEVIGALEDYLYREIDRYYPETIGGFDDTSKLAEKLYHVVVEALHERGFVVDADQGLAEDSDELTIEDVLLPKHDQGADLAGEVTTADVADPDRPHRHGPPDNTYTSRLMTLAGINKGPDEIV
jgi:hypothetical protein